MATFTLGSGSKRYRKSLWTANRNRPAPSGSTVEITTNGRLVLKDDKNAEFLTIAGSFDGGVGSAAMFDNGNFVLQSSSADIKWQSFEHPTDTILPGQALEPESMLYAAASDTDISTGRYFLKMQGDGNLVLSWSNSPTDVGNDAYSSDTSGTPGKLVFDNTGVIYISRPNGTRVDFWSSKPKSPKNPNGSLAQSWGIVWSSKPSPCFIPGICGLNGYCQMKNDTAPDCLCPTGFNYVNPNNRFMGCQQNFPVQQCSGLTSNDYIFQSLENIDWPMGDFLQMNNVDESRCRDVCLSDCLCTVAIYRSNTCWKKKIPMYNGRVDLSLGSKALLKMPKENISMIPLPNSRNVRKCKDARYQLPFIILLCLISVDQHS